MGGADIIPGVSGGTVALILGIYQRLVSAISNVDGTLFGLVARRQWRAAAVHIDLRFLMTLGFGIFAGIACLASLMHSLLLHQRPYTLSVFFGLILASSYIVLKMLSPSVFKQRVACYGLALAAAVFAFWLVGLDQIGFHDHLGYFFLCGMLAICAMILPGISGSYILWLLGAYVAVTGIIKSVLKLECTQRELLCLLIFAAGCAIGLVGFSKLIKWSLSRAHDPIMAVLGGFMIGSLRLMWPFQRDLTPKVEKLKEKRYVQRMPDTWDNEVTLCIILAVVAVVFVVALERWGSANETDGQLIE